MDYGKSRDPYNQTNSNDPASVRSRVFVGNLNTEKCTREFLQNVFGKYGLVQGASVMKGYGFVQFADEYTARRASEAEDGNVYFGQQVDCNLACEPKAKHGKGGRKRKADGQVDGSDGAYDYSSDYWSAAGYPGMPGVAPLMGQAMPGMMYPPGYPPQMDPAAAWYAAAGAPPPPPPGAGPQPLMDAAPFGAHPKAGGLAKKPKPYGTTKRDTNSTAFIQYPHLALKKKQSTAVGGIGQKSPAKPKSDIVICGRCKTQFADVEKLVAHKRETPQCSARTICTCDTDAIATSTLACARCEVTVANAWALLAHYRDVHETELHKVQVPEPEPEPVQVQVQVPTPTAPTDTEMSK